MPLCNVFNCEFNNNYHDCDIDPIIDESGKCESKRIDDKKCSECGSELQVIYESRGEYFGTPSIEETLFCPGCGC